MVMDRSLETTSVVKTARTIMTKMLSATVKEYPVAKKRVEIKISPGNPQP